MIKIILLIIISTILCSTKKNDIFNVAKRDIVKYLPELEENRISNPSEDSRGVISYDYSEPKLENITLSEPVQLYYVPAKFILKACSTEISIDELIEISELKWCVALLIDQYLVALIEIVKNKEGYSSILRAGYLDRTSKNKLKKFWNTKNITLFSVMDCVNYRSYYIHLNRLGTNNCTSFFTNGHFLIEPGIDIVEDINGTITRINKNN